MNKQHQSTCTLVASQYSGFSLLEVLVALLVLSIGLLGIAGMQGSSLTKTRDSALKTQAMMMSQEILADIRSNSSVIQSYALTVNDNPTTTKDCLVDPCTANERAAYDLHTWWSKIGANSTTSIFPSGSAEISIAPVAGTTLNMVSVTIRWNETVSEKNPDTDVLEEKTINKQYEISSVI